MRDYYSNYAKLNGVVMIFLRSGQCRSMQVNVEKCLGGVISYKKDIKK